MKGLCVFGPKDGEIVECSHPIYRAAVREPLWISADYSIPAEPAPIKTVNYEFHVGLRSGTRHDFRMDFWLPEGKTIEDAFERLYTVYHHLNASSIKR